MATLVGAAVFLCIVGLGLSQDVPKYSSQYRITGAIRLPYAEIVEPFTAYYDGANSRSRVDYYNGVQKTFNFASAPGYPHGLTYLVVPVTTKTELNKVTCFQTGGFPGMPVEVTNVLPDLTGFKFTGAQLVEGQLANTYKKVNTEGKKTSTYTFWSSAADDRPLRYEMMGYDSLLGSHFDKYYVDYNDWISAANFSDQDFSVPAGMKCGDFPGPGISRHRAVELEPIREFVHHYDGHVADKFAEFKVGHGKAYSPAEHEARQHVFRQNLRFINSVNRAGRSYKLAVNHLADKTSKELKTRQGYRYTHGNRGGKPFTPSMLSVAEVPDQWDWRLLGAVTPVKDQAICGSCWSFGTTGTIEGAYFLKSGNLVRLSQQELVDCSWGYGNNGCDGGEDFRAYKYMIENGGLTSEDQYGQYLAIDGQCKKNKVTPVVQLANYTLLPEGDENALKVAIFENGPISVAIDASHRSLSFYANGVYYEPKCRNDPDGLDHAVLAVGFGTLNGEDYWLVKNSWSTYWGNDGYVLMSRKNNNCGVATAASYVQLK